MLNRTPPGRHRSFVVRELLSLTTKLFSWLLRLILQDKTGNFAINIPMATYCPWKESKHFYQTYKTVKSHTLNDIYKLYSLYSISLDCMNKPGDVIEVGVWRGGSGCILASAQANHGTRVFLFDTFKGVVKSSERDTFYKGGEHADSSKAIVENLIKSQNLENIILIEGVFPESAAHLAIHKIKMCHIDVDTYRSTKEATEWIWPRLAIGGVIVFDDYGGYSTEGVRSYVKEMRLLPGRTTIENLNGQAIVIKTV